MVKIDPHAFKRGGSCELDAFAIPVSLSACSPSSRRDATNQVSQRAV